MYLPSGTYYLAEYGTNKWINLGRDYVKAMASYAEIVTEDCPCKTMGDRIDRYLREVATKNAISY